MADLIDIKDHTGKTILSVPVNKGGRRKFQLMKDDYILLRFTLGEPAAFPLGTYAECDFGRFEVVEEQTASYDTATGGHAYGLKLEAPYRKWRNKLFKYQPEVTGGSEASFSLAAPLATHMAVFLRCLKAWGYRHGGQDYRVVIDSGVTGENLYLTYSNTNLIDALTMMAEAAGCEWWVDGADIHFGRLESAAAPVTLRVGVNAASMSLSKSGGEYFTRIFAFGSTNNISPRYRKKIAPFVVDTLEADGDSSARFFQDSRKPVNPGMFRSALMERPSVRLGGEVGKLLEFSQAAGGGGMTVAVEFEAYDLGTAGSFPILQGDTFTLDFSQAQVSFGLQENQRLDVAVAVLADGLEGGYANRGKELHTASFDLTATSPSVDLGRITCVSPCEGRLESVRVVLTCVYYLGQGVAMTGSVTFSKTGVVVAESAYASVSTVARYVDGDGVERTLSVEVNHEHRPYDDPRASLIWENTGNDRLAEGTAFTLDGLVRTRVPIGYFDADADGLTVNGVVQRRLMLPEGIPYVDIYDGMTDDEVIEGIVTFDYIQPGKTFTVSAVDKPEWTDVMEEYTDADGETQQRPTGVRVPTYTIRCKDLAGFAQECVIGDALTATFQSGSLAGMSFGLAFQPDKGTESEAVFTVVPNEDYGGRLPDTVMRPEAGATFVMAGYDTEYFDSGLTAEAEQRLYEETLKCKQKLIGNKGTVTVPVRPGWAAERCATDGTLHPFEAGTTVVVDNRSIFPSPTAMRVIGYELNLDIPTDTPQYTLGESPAYSRLGALEDKLDAVSLNGSRYLAGTSSGTGGGTSLQVLKTGDSAPASDANVYSAARTDAEIRRQTAGMDAKYLSRVRDDRAKGKLGFDGGFEVGQTVDSLTAGRGILADVLSGRMQMQRLEVRGSMTVVDLIVNEIHAMMGDFSFSDAGKIDYVEEVPAGAADEEDAYWLWLRKETEADLTTFSEGDVVYSIVNTLRIGGTDYYTSWMRVAAVDLEENRILAVLYPGAEVPGGVNYPPVAGYNLTRRGNNVIPESGTNERAQSWLISSREGRMMFLANVYKPVLEDYNYALVAGKLPPLPSLRDAGVPDGVTGVMADWVVAANFREYDYNGDVRAKLVFRGDWSAETAKGASPYRNVGVDMSAAGGGYTLLERHTVRHAGCLWGCIADKTEAEPKWNSTGWTLMEGNSNYSITFNSTNGFSFFLGGVDTVIEARLHYGNTDITEDIVADPACSVSWSRDSGDTAVDNAWKPTHEDGAENTLRVTDDDMPPNWGFKTRTVKFVCKIYVPDRAEPVASQIGFNI